MCDQMTFKLEELGQHFTILCCKTFVSVFGVCFAGCLYNVLSAQKIP